MYNESDYSIDIDLDSYAILPSPDCATWPAAAAAAAATTTTTVYSWGKSWPSRVDQDQVANRYSAAWNARSASSQKNLAPCLSSIDIRVDDNPETTHIVQIDHPLDNSSHSITPIAPSLESLDLPTFQNQSQFEPPNCWTREGTPSSGGTNYIRDFNFVNNL